MRLEVTHRFAIPLRDGFDYIAEPGNWPEYWPGLLRVQPGSLWRAPGDHARVVMRLLGRNVELDREAVLESNADGGEATFMAYVRQPCLHAGVRDEAVRVERT